MTLLEVAVVSLVFCFFSAGGKSAVGAGLFLSLWVPLESDEEVAVEDEDVVEPVVALEEPLADGADRGAEEPPRPRGPSLPPPPPLLPSRSDLPSRWSR